MTIIKRIETYGAALQKWKSLRDRRNRMLAAGRLVSKELAPMPMPEQFQLSRSDEWAIKTYQSVFGKIPQRKQQ